MEQMLKHAAKELRSVRSVDDLKNLGQKLQFLLFRMRGDFMKGTRGPPALQMEPTNGCNLRCACCSGWSNQRKRGYMDFRLFCRIVDEAADIGVKRIHLYLHGEPLLHHQIGEMMRHIKSRELAVTMATNAMLMTDKKISDLLRSGMTSADYILLSMLGHSKETHEKMMPGANHEQVLTNIRKLLDYRNSHQLKGPIIETVFFKTPENAREEDEYYAYWHKVVDNARVAHASLQYSSFRSGAFPGPSRTKTCNQLWERMTIQWNGDVTMCHADIDGKTVLGNLREKSIRELWNCEQVSAVRQYHREGNFSAVPMCASCDW
jgi:radical SAM protein with 4Fe4S-binding SPASM domain